MKYHFILYSVLALPAQPFFLCSLYLIFLFSAVSLVLSHFLSCRYFVLDPEVGQLQYYLNELSKSQRPPRGSLPLLGAMVVSSDEFPYMFTIQFTTGDSYKLRGKTMCPDVLYNKSHSEYFFVTGKLFSHLIISYYEICMILHDNVTYVLHSLLQV